MVLLGLKKRQIIMLAVLVSGTFVAMLNQTLITPALPSIMKELNINASTVQWLTTAYTLVNAIMIPITAYLTDRFSTRRLFIASMILFAIGSAFAAWAPVFSIILIGRIIQAAGGGILMPMVMTVLMLAFPTEQRGRAMGMFGLVVAFAPALGPTVSGIVIDVLSWHVMFVIVVALSVVVIVFAFIVLDHDADNINPDVVLDKLSVVMSTIGFGSLLYGFSTIGSSGNLIVACVAMVVGAVVLVMFFVRQLKMDVPMLRVRILKNRRFAVSTIVTMIVQAALMSNAILIPIFVQDLCGYSATVSGFVMLPGAILTGIMGPISGRWFDKYGPRVMSIVGTLLLTAATVVLVTLNTSYSMIALCGILIVRHFAVTLINMPVSTWGVNALDDKVINHGNALSNTFRQVASSFGTALIISVYSIVSEVCSATMPSIDANVFALNVAFGLQVVFGVVAVVVAVVAIKDKPEDISQEYSSKDREITVKSLMHANIYLLHDDVTVADAVKLFLDKNISAAPLVDKSGRVLGMVSDGDVIRALSRKDKVYMDPIVAILNNAKEDSTYKDKIDKIMQMPAIRIATAGVISIDINMGIDDACRVLGENHLKKAPVVSNGHIVGIINRSDITMHAMNIYLNEHAIG